MLLRPRRPAAEPNRTELPRKASDQVWAMAEGLIIGWRIIVRLPIRAAR
jgi:hypothetical protein